MKKVVLKLDVYDEKAKQKALKTVSTIPGIDFIGIDVTQAQAQLTVIGTMDPVSIVSKLRKNWPTTDIIIVGPAIEPKKEEEKKDEPKKEETGKEDAKKEEEKKDEGKKDEEKKVEMAVLPELVQAYRAYYYPQMTNTYYVQSMEENPNACIIC